MTRPDHDLSLLKGDNSSWQLSPGSGKKVSTHPQRLQIILHASRSSPGPAAAFKAVGGLARGVNVLLDTNVLCRLGRVATACSSQPGDS